MIIEKSFPRGGVPAKESKGHTNKKENIIFGALQKKLKKSKSKKSTSDLKDLFDQQNDDIIETRSAELLSYETIQDGMLIMGMVSSVDQLYVTVSLPGRMFARISALEISESYTKVAREFLVKTDQVTNYKTLQELYEVGQLVYGRVQEVKHNKHGRPEIVMTFKPSEVHTDLVHTNVRKGFNFNGAIEEVQEHGYIIESGVKGLRAFLPLEKAQKNLAQGQLIYLKVEKITIDKMASTCICKQVPIEQLKIKSLQTEPNIDYILPSTIVSLNVTKCLKDGLQGTIMNEAFTAYVNEHQLGEPLMLPEDYEINGNYDARILYVMPLTKLVYLTLNLRKSSSKKETSDSDDKDRPFKHGDVIENARVHHLGTGGVVLVLNNEVKGLISYKTIKMNYKGNYDQDELLSKYAKKTKHKVRILGYDIMDSLYICTDDVKVVNEKCFSLDDLKPGEFTTAIVKSFNTKVEGYNVQIGKVKGIIEKLYLTPSTKQHESSTKLRCRIVGVNKERKVAYLTNRAEYMAKDVELLVDIEEAKKNKVFIGTIVNVSKEYFLVRFFNDITGVLFKNHLREVMLNENSEDDLSVGQTMKFRIQKNNGGKITLGLADNACELGELCNGKVSHVLETGLEVNVESDNQEENSSEIKGLVPLRLLSDFQDLIVAKARTYSVGAELKTTSLRRNIFSVRDVKYFQQNPPKDWKSVKPGDILRAYVENVNDDVIELSVPIRGYGKLVKVHLKMLLLHAYKSSNVVLNPEQVVYVKVLGKVDATKTISISALLTMVWDQQLSSTANYLESYLDEISVIRTELKKKKSAIAHFSIGDKITVIFQGIDSETNDWHFVEKDQKVSAIVKSSILIGSKVKQPKSGSKQEAIILWIDYSNDIIYISPKAEDMKHITNSTQLPDELKNTKNFDAKVLLKQENVFICSLKKGPNPLVFCPIRLHYNDFENSASATIKEGDYCKLNFIHKTKPIAVLQETWKLWQNVAKSKRKRDEKTEASPLAPTPAKKNKLEKEEIKEKKVKKSKIVESDEEEIKTKKLKLESKTPNILFYEDTTPSTSSAHKTSSSTTKKSLDGITDFWTTTDLSQLNNDNDDESSEDDDTGNNSEDADSSKQKKKKISAVEKFKQQRNEEAHLREIEEQYADPNHLPDSVDQFDRLVLSDPNNSKFWINYMVFHLQAAEIEKARAVARRAMKAISMRNVDDHLNIWIALLNLEIRYGSRDSFDSTLKEALTFNEPIKIYLRVVEILREAKKNQELIEIVNIITKKFKSVQDVWKSSADAYFHVGMTDQAQQMLHKALASLPEREHVNTIVLFANMNHRHGCKEMAQTLLDQIVTSYPKRVDVWTQYVDMLVKDQLIESARSVLERAILQNIPLKKMRTIFKKYLEFEERHGTEADVEKVKRLATEYVKNNANV